MSDSCVSRCAAASLLPMMQGRAELNWIDAPSSNFDERQQPVSMIVLHYTSMKTAEEAIARLCDSEAKVSSHWLVAEDGQIVRLVDEDKRAWHAGRSHWRGVTDIIGGDRDRQSGA